MESQGNHDSGMLLRRVLQLAAVSPALLIILFNLGSFPWIVVAFVGLVIAGWIVVRWWRARSPRRSPQFARDGGASSLRTGLMLLVTSIATLLVAVAVFSVTTIKPPQSTGQWVLQADTTEIMVTPVRAGFDEDIFRVSQDSPALARESAAGKRPSSPVATVIPSRGAGLFLREVSIASDPSRTATLSVVVRGMPRGRFYEGLNSKDLAVNPYLGTEGIRWKVTDFDDGVAFGYMWPDGAQYIREPLGAFFGVNSVTQFVLALVFLSLAAFVSPGVGSMLASCVRRLWEAAAKAVESAKPKEPDPED
jgi:hypothetical protein